MRRQGSATPHPYSLPFTTRRAVAPSQREERNQPSTGIGTYLPIADVEVPLSVTGIGPRFAEADDKGKREGK